MSDTLTQNQNMMMIWNGFILSSPMTPTQYKNVASKFIDTSTNRLKPYKAYLATHAGNEPLRNLAGSDGLVDLMSNDAWRSGREIKLISQSYLLGISSESELLVASVQPASSDVNIVDRMDSANYIDYVQGLRFKMPESQLSVIDSFKIGGQAPKGTPLEYLLDASNDHATSDPMYIDKLITRYYVKGSLMVDVSVPTTEDPNPSPDYEPVTGKENLDLMFMKSGSVGQMSDAVMEIDFYTLMADLIGIADKTELGWDMFEGTLTSTLQTWTKQSLTDKQIYMVDQRDLIVKEEMLYADSTSIYASLITYTDAFALEFHSDHALDVKVDARGFIVSWH